MQIHAKTINIPSWIPLIDNLNLLAALSIIIT